jgi:hypothetical protein
LEYAELPTTGMEHAKMEMLENRVSFLEKMIEKKKVFFKQILNKIDRCNSF